MYIFMCGFMWMEKSRTYIHIHSHWFVSLPPITFSLCVYSCHCGWKRVVHMYALVRVFIPFSPYVFIRVCVCVYEGETYKCTHSFRMCLRMGGEAYVHNLLFLYIELYVRTFICVWMWTRERRTKFRTYSCSYPFASTPTHVLPLPADYSSRGWRYYETGRS